jgi:hypothetical protein
MSVMDWLRSRLSPQSDDEDPDALVLLAEADGEAVAGLWAGILEQRGVHCMVKNASSLAHLRMGWIYRLYVARRDEDYARELLGLDAEPSAPSPDASDDGGAP